MKGKETKLPVVGHVDNGLLTLVPDQLHLVLDVDDGDAVVVLDVVEDADLDGARVAAVHVRAGVGVEQGVLAGALQQRGALKVAPPPAAAAAVQGVRSVVGLQLVGLAVQALDDAVADAVGDAADGGAEPGVQGIVSIFLVEAEHDVLAGDGQFLDDGAAGGEFDGHGAVCEVTMMGNGRRSVWQKLLFITIKK